MLNVRLPRSQRARHARTSIAFALAIMGAGSVLSCSDDGIGPGGGPVSGGGAGDDGGSPPAVLATLELRPATADLCAQRNRVQLTAVALDQKGAEVQVGPGMVTYFSSDSEVAVVSSQGVVTGAAPGTAVITATFTYRDTTRTATMNATVHETPAEYPELAGVYDVDAMITGSPWGPPGTRESAVFTIQHSRDTPLFAGTFEDFRFFDPPSDESVYGPLAGSITGSLDCTGRVLFELQWEGMESNLWHAEGTLDSRQITGYFWDPGSNVGTFTAAPRTAELLTPLHRSRDLSARSRR